METRGERSVGLSAQVKAIPRAALGSRARALGDPSLRQPHLVRLQPKKTATSANADKKEMGSMTLEFRKSPVIPFAIRSHSLTLTRLPSCSRMASTQQPPPFAEKDQCEKCNVKFGTFTRRHHCRQCGARYVECIPLGTFPVACIRAQGPYA